jgi:hypothetical protein
VSHLIKVRIVIEDTPTLIRLRVIN